MRIAEVFHSIQGEGKLAGVPSAFIRTSGCNLRCTWCDTPYTSWSPEGEARSVESIVRAVSDYPTRFAVVTGGEPMIQPDVGELTRNLRQAGFHITIETAATVYHQVECDLASLSPKLAGSTPRSLAGKPPVAPGAGKPPVAPGGGKSPVAPGVAEAHELLRLNVPVIQRFMDSYEHQLKFVVDSRPDVDEIDRLLERLRGVEAANVLLMPQGTEAAELDGKAGWVAECCKQRGYRFCPRLHIMLYGNVRGM